MKPYHCHQCSLIDAHLQPRRGQGGGGTSAVRLQTGESLVYSVASFIQSPASYDKQNSHPMASQETGLPITDAAE